MEDLSGYLYVMLPDPMAKSQGKLGKVKIGFSTDPARRARGLGCTVLCQCPGTMLEERDLHRELNKTGPCGEWYTFRPAVVEAIRQIASKQRAPALPRSDVIALQRIIDRQAVPVSTPVA